MKIFLSFSLSSSPLGSVEGRIFSYLRLDLVSLLGMIMSAFRSESCGLIPEWVSDWLRLWLICDELWPCLCLAWKFADFKVSKPQDFMRRCCFVVEFISLRSWADLPNVYGYSSWMRSRVVILLWTPEGLEKGSIGVLRSPCTNVCSMSITIDNGGLSVSIRGFGNWTMPRWFHLVFTV